MKEPQYDVYRKGHNPATSMDWAVRTSDAGLEIRAGATDRPATLTTVPLGRCEGGSPDREMTRQIAQKAAEGYRRIGEGTYAKGRLELTRAEPVVGDELYWEIAKAIPEKRLRKILKTIGEALFAHTAQVAMEATEDGKGVLGLIVPTPGDEWAFGQNARGGLNADGRGGGVVRRAQGVVPVLVLMRLARDLPGTVTFADGRADAITPELRATDPWVGRDAGPIEETQAIATALGLCLASQVVVDDSEQGSAIFF